jgi:hypothetical protein
VGWHYRAGTIHMNEHKKFKMLSTPIFSLQLTNDCNMNCHCDNLKYTPVCSETNGMTYYSACHAGCGYVFNNSMVRLHLGITQLTEAEAPYSVLLFILHYKWVSLWVRGCTMYVCPAPKFTNLKCSSVHTHKNKKVELTVSLIKHHVMKACEEVEV